MQQYQWLTSQDERVRPSHVANSGGLFDWASPPPDTGHPGEDILCRCNAVAVLTQALRDKLKDAAGPASITTIDALPPAPPLVTPPVPPMAPPTPIPILPTPLATPVSPPSPTYQSLNQKARLPAEEAYHNRAWGGASEEVLRGVADTPGLKDLVHEGGVSAASYRAFSRKLNMGSARSTKLEDAVWRHEFGHHMDHMLRSLPEHSPISWKYSYSSASKAFDKAKNADRKLLKSALPPKGQAGWGISTRKHNESLNMLTRSVKKLPADARQGALVTLADELDLDLADVRAFMADQGILGAPVDISQVDQDALVYRFLLSWKHRDVQGALDTLGGIASSHLQAQPAASLRIALDLDLSDDALKTMNVWAGRDTGTFQHWSDLADVLTVRRVNGGWGHSNSYFNEIAGRRQAEIFANMVSMMGESEFARKMVQRYHPNLYDYMLDQMGKMKTVPTTP